MHFIKNKITHSVIIKIIIFIYNNVCLGNTYIWYVPCNLILFNFLSRLVNESNYFFISIHINLFFCSTFAKIHTYWIISSETNWLSISLDIFLVIFSMNILTYVLYWKPPGMGGDVIQIHFKIYSTILCDFGDV